MRVGGAKATRNVPRSPSAASTFDPKWQWPCRGIRVGSRSQHTHPSPLPYCPPLPASAYPPPAFCFAEDMLSLAGWDDSTHNHPPIKYSASIHLYRECRFTGSVRARTTHHSMGDPPMPVCGSALVDCGECALDSTCQAAEWMGVPILPRTYLRQT